MQQHTCFAPDCVFRSGPPQSNISRYTRLCTGRTPKTPPCTKHGTVQGQQTHCMSMMRMTCFSTPKVAAEQRLHCRCCPSWRWRQRETIEATNGKHKYKHRKLLFTHVLWTLLDGHSLRVSHHWQDPSSQVRHIRISCGSAFNSQTGMINIL
jgi:hypothetical protein